MMRSATRLLLFLLLLHDNASDNVFNHKPTSEQQPLVLESRIVGGNIAHPKRFEYFVLIRVFEDGAVKRCAGSLVHDDIVLTAGHCVPDTADRVIAWVNYTRDDIETGYEYVVEAVDWKQHEDYNTETGLNDIGVVKLKHSLDWLVPVNYNKIAPIPEDNQPVRVFGFGKTEEGSFSDKLRVVGVRVVPFQKCNSKGFHDGNIDDQSMICAGAVKGGKDACGGDSGAPLIVGGRNASQDVQVGIVSWGVGCGLAAKPGVYTRVSTYAEWIHEQICELTATTHVPCILSGVWELVISSGSMQDTENTSPAPVARPAVSPAPVAETDPEKSEEERESYNGGMGMGKMNMMGMVKEKQKRLVRIADESRAQKLVKPFRGSQ